jgi:hypothetical protein
MMRFEPYAAFLSTSRKRAEYTQYAVSIAVPLMPMRVADLSIPRNFKLGQFRFLLSLVARGRRGLYRQAMTVLRGATTFVLCLFLALTSVTLAVARGAPQPVGVMVICTGEGVQRVAVDAGGMPAGPPHVCPDCLLALHATAPPDPLPAPRGTCTAARHPFAKARHVTYPARPATLARAPPLSV